MSTVHESSPVLTVAAAPGVAARLLLDRPGRETLADYRAGGGYQPVTDIEALLDAVDRAGLRGRGGSAFPTGRKLRTVHAADTRPVVVANGEEGEPTSVKDRWLLRTRPHLVLDGLRLAAFAVGADLAYVYLSDEKAARAVTAAVEEASLEIDVRVHVVASGYVAGEETAAVRSINGGPAKPTDKPPRPYESGVGARPTLVSNVETLANLPFIAAHGAETFRALGTDRAPGTFLLTIGGAVRRPGLYEVELGTVLGEVVEQAGGPASDVSGLLMGGYFAGLLARRALDLPLDYDTLGEAGSGLGCGAVTVLGEADCPVGVAADVMAYFDRENADQCGSCFNGTAAMAAVPGALRGRAASRADVDRLRRWSVELRGRGACATLDGATNVAASLLREFPRSVEEHLDAQCARCAATKPVDEPFAVSYEGGEI